MADTFLIAEAIWRAGWNKRRSLLRVLAIQGSDLGPETNYPDWVSTWIFSVPADKRRFSSFKLGQDYFLHHYSAITLLNDAL
jgi:hypothetical protein